MRQLDIRIKDLGDIRDVYERVVKSRGSTFLVSCLRRIVTYSEESTEWVSCSLEVEARDTSDSRERAAQLIQGIQEDYDVVEGSGWDAKLLGCRFSFVMPAQQYFDDCKKLTFRELLHKAGPEFMRNGYVTLRENTVLMATYG